MKSIAVILTSEELDNNDINFQKLIEFCGIEFKVIFIENDISELVHLTEAKKIELSCIALNGLTLQRICNHKETANELLSFLIKHIPFLFVYGIYPGRYTDKSIKFITGGIISKVLKSVSPDSQFKVNSNYSEICRQFSGLSFGPINQTTDFTFKIDKQSNIVSNLITIETQPFFVRVMQEICQIFLVASSQIIGPSELILEEFDVRSSFSQLVPALLFIRYVFKNKCWHKAMSHACLIIDDPLLRPKYGFLNYRQLLDEMNRNNFSATIAFIPWNYKRTDKKISDLLIENNHKFSICVHGCDHTGGEFGVTDINVLNRKIKLAIERMQYHEERTGLKYDKLMIFPQGIFSSKALKILKSNNFIAAINTEVVPTDAVGQLKGYGTIEMAIMDYESFSLFIRREPVNIEEIAFDLFIGRPALIVVHHDWFKDGGKDLFSFIKRINLIDNSIQWCTLGDLIKRSYMIKEESDKTVHVKVYANSAIIQNESNDHRRYLISKPEYSKVPIDYVTVNDEKIPFEVTNGYLYIVYELSPKKTANLDIVYRDLFTETSEKVSVLECIKVMTRRYLCELRDNCLSRNATIEHVTSKLYRKIFIGRKFGRK